MTKLLDEKIKKRQNDAMMTENPPLIEDPPSPIERHNSLEEQMTQGSFVPQGRDDILNTTIGRPDHGGRVRAAGTSRASSTSSISITQEQLTKIIGSLREKVRNEIEKEKKQSLETWKKDLKDAIIIEMSQKGSQVSAPTHADVNVLGARVSTKESIAEIGVNPSGEEQVGHVTPTMGLHVQRQDSTLLVVLGKIYHGASTIHCVAYIDDVVRVSVENLIDCEAEVPFPTSKIKYVRWARNTCIAWPTTLVKLVSNEDSTITPNKVNEAVEGVNDVVVHDPLRELIKSLVDIYDKPVQFVWDDSSLFLTYADVNEITSGDKCLNIALLQLWTMYMDEWNNSLGHGSVYEFLKPQSIHNAKDRHGQCEEYIEKWLKESHDKAHWQMIVLCPTNNVVVWFCSLRKKPDVHIKTAINNAFKTLKTIADGKVPQTTPQVTFNEEAMSVVEIINCFFFTMCSDSVMARH
ncbi:hypothetical protein HKD37_17G048728 [Glycine soja]